jgi:phage-related protein
VKGLETRPRIVRAVRWLGETRETIRGFPEAVKDDIGTALFAAQIGEKHEDAKPLKGFGGAGVLEIIANYDGDTFRAIYTVKFKQRVYVLHCFQKKSKRGSRTPRHDIELIRERLRWATEIESRTEKG